MKPRWMIERKRIEGNKLYTIVEVYAEGENKEKVKEENKQWSYKRELIR